MHSLKSYISILTFLFIVFSLSCDQKNENEIITGKWTLVNFECCELPREKFDNNQIIWEISSKKKVISIVNNVSLSQSQYFFEDGDYEIISIDDISLTFIYKERDYKFNYVIENNELELTRNISSDGMIIIFKKT